MANGARIGVGVSWMAVVITDDVSMNETATLIAAQAARAAGISIITVGVGTYLDLYEITSTASYPYWLNSFTVPSVKNLSILEDPIKQILCTG